MARTSVAPINATRTSGGLGGRMFRKSVASAKSSTADAAWPSLSKRRRVCGRRTTTAQRSVAGAIAAARQCWWPTRRVRGQKDARGGLDVRQLEPSDVGCRSRVTRNTAERFARNARPAATGGHRWRMSSCTCVSECLSATTYLDVAPAQRPVTGQAALLAAAHGALQQAHGGVHAVGAVDRSGGRRPRRTFHLRGAVRVVDGRQRRHQASKCPCGARVFPDSEVLGRVGIKIRDQSGKCWIVQRRPSALLASYTAA